MRGREAMQNGRGVTCMGASTIRPASNMPCHSKWISGGYSFTYYRQDEAADAKEGFCQYEAVAIFNRGHAVRGGD